MALKYVAALPAESFADVLRQGWSEIREDRRAKVVTALQQIGMRLEAGV